MIVYVYVLEIVWLRVLQNIYILQSVVRYLLIQRHYSWELLFFFDLLDPFNVL